MLQSKPIRSMQAAGIVQDMFAGGGKEETTGVYFYHYFYRSLPFLSTWISVTKHSHAHAY